jgi:hypothetical protein
MSLRESYDEHKTGFVVGVTCLILILGGLYYYGGRSKQVKYIPRPPGRARSLRPCRRPGRSIP